MPLALASTEDVLPYIASTRAVDANRDALLTRLIAAASARIIRYTERVFAPEPALQGQPGADTAPPVTKTFQVRRRSGYVRVPDLREVTSITYGGLVLDSVFGYELWGRDGEPSTHVKILSGSISPYVGTNILSVTGRWGFLEIPDDIKDATCLWVARRYKMKDANYADTVMQGVEGAAFQYFNQIPVDIKLTLDAYRQQVRAALV